jgi:hypothetical protein
MTTKGLRQKEKRMEWLFKPHAHLYTHTKKKKNKKLNK